MTKRWFHNGNCFYNVRYDIKYSRKTNISNAWFHTKNRFHNVRLEIHTINSFFWSEQTTRNQWEIQDIYIFDCTSFSDSITYDWENHYFTTHLVPGCKSKMATEINGFIKHISRHKLNIFQKSSVNIYFVKQLFH